MKTYDYKIILSVAILLAVIGVLGIVWQRPWKTFGEVAVNTQTYATTTPGLADLTNLCPARVGMASSTTGVLDFVDILGLTKDASFQILDSTTSNVTLTDGRPTSTSLIVGFPVTTATSSHKYGVQFNRGLLIDYTAGTATTTIGYRCEG